MRKGGRQSAQGLLVLQLLQCVCCNTWQKSGSIPEEVLSGLVVQIRNAGVQKTFALLCAACKFFLGESLVV